LGIYQADLRGDGIRQVALVLHDGVRVLEPHAAHAQEALGRGLALLAELQALEAALRARPLPRHEPCAAPLA
jgi:hypothetical protein